MTILSYRYSSNMSLLGYRPGGIFVSLAAMAGAGFRGFLRYRDKFRILRPQLFNQIFQQTEISFDLRSLRGLEEPD
jgi:hypothetical protein